MLNLDYDIVRGMFESGMTITAVSRELGVSKNSIMAYCERWGYDYGKQRYNTGRWDADITLDYELNDEGIEMLITAIVKCAVKDYAQHYKSYTSTLPEERFFMSDWFSDLMQMCEADVSGEELMKRVRMEIYDGGEFE